MQHHRVCLVDITINIQKLFTTKKSMRLGTCGRKLVEICYNEHNLLYWKTDKEECYLYMINLVVRFLLYFLLVEPLHICVLGWDSECSLLVLENS